MVHIDAEPKTAPYHSSYLRHNVVSEGPKEVARPDAEVGKPFGRQAHQPNCISYLALSTLRRIMLFLERIIHVRASGRGTG
jgi:hypothetical protein